MNIPTLKVNAWGSIFTVSPSFGRYENGRLAVTFEDSETGEPFGTFTINLPEGYLGKGEVFAKDWSENAPLFNALSEAHWIKETGRVVASGFVAVKVVVFDGPLAEFYRSTTA